MGGKGSKFTSGAGTSSNVVPKGMGQLPPGLLRVLAGQEQPQGPRAVSGWDLGAGTVRGRGAISGQSCCFHRMCQCSHSTGVEVLSPKGRHLSLRQIRDTSTAHQST